MRALKKGWTIAAGLAALIVAGILFLGGLLFIPRALPAAVLTVSPGEGIATLSRRLEAGHFLTSRRGFLLAAYVQRLDQNLTAGTYHLPKNASVWRLATTLAAKPARIRFTIKSGDNYPAIRAKLLANEKIKAVYAPLPEKEILQLLTGEEKETSLEGLLAPETFFVFEGTSDAPIYRRAYRLQQEALTRAWATRAPDLPYRDAYQLLIAASLVEKETGSPEDRPLIAAVLVNRLKKGMRLQIDPAVIYGLGSDYQGRLTKKELRLDTPYNTYTRRGLPPTPIAMPSREALHAAAHPAAVDYLYFVAKKDGTGKSHFSRTLPEHERAVKLYLLGK